MGIELFLSGTSVFLWIYGAYLGDIEVSDPDQGKKANVAISQSYDFFGFPVHMKKIYLYFTLAY